MSEGSLIDAESASRVGTVAASATGEVNRRDWQRWAAAVGDHNPLYFDPNYARAVLNLGQLQASYAGQFASSPEEGERWLADAEKTIRHGVALAPGFGPGYASLADLDRGRLRYGPALAGFRKALLLAPGNPNTLTRALNALPWIGTLAEAEPQGNEPIPWVLLPHTLHVLALDAFLEHRQRFSARMLADDAWNRLDEIGREDVHVVQLAEDVLETLELVDHR